MAEIRKTVPKAYAPWTAGEEAALRKMKKEGMAVEEIAGKLNRNTGAIRSRLLKLESEFRKKS